MEILISEAGSRDGYYGYEDSKEGEGGRSIQNKIDSTRTMK